MRRIVKITFRRHTVQPPDQNTAELIDTADRGGRIIYRWRDRLERDIDNLDNAEFNVLLHRAGRPDIDGREQLKLLCFGNSVRRRNFEKYNAVRNKMTYAPCYDQTNSVRFG